jgi:hypothetical protein
MKRSHWIVGQPRLALLGPPGLDRIDPPLVDIAPLRTLPGIALLPAVPVIVRPVLQEPEMRIKKKKKKGIAMSNHCTELGLC